MQIRQRIFKHTAMQVLHFFSRQNLQNFDISHAFLPLTIAKLSTFKYGPGFFGPPCISHLYYNGFMGGSFSVHRKTIDALLLYRPRPIL